MRYDRASGHEGANDCLYIELSQVWILLAHADEDDRLARGVNHVESGAYLLVNGVELGHDDAVNDSWILVLHGEVNERLIELGQLIDGVVADEGFTDEEDSVRLVDVNQLSERSHQGLIALHSSSSVDEHDVILLGLGLLQSFLGNHGWVVLVAFLIERHV